MICLQYINVVNAYSLPLHYRQWCVTILFFCWSKATVNGFSKTCHEVHKHGGNDGYYNIDPEQDKLDPVYVFCNMSSTPITAIVHHDREEWTFVSGYEKRGSYNGQVGSTANITPLESIHKLRRWNKKVCRISLPISNNVEKWTV